MSNVRLYEQLSLQVIITFKHISNRSVESFAGLGQIFTCIRKQISFCNV